MTKKKTTTKKTKPFVLLLSERHTEMIKKMAEESGSTTKAEVVRHCIASTYQDEITNK